MRSRQIQLTFEIGEVTMKKLSTSLGTFVCVHRPLKQSPYKNLTISVFPLRFIAKDMPILMMAEQPNLDAGTYAMMIKQLMPLLRSAKGFVSHAGGPSPAGGMRITEIWESQADQEKFFNENLKPNLPPGLEPDLSYQELHTAFTR
jgi:hypothetical protein